MENTDKLIVQKLKEQCKAMIWELQDNNLNLEVCKEKLQAFANNTELEGEAYKAAQNQIERYLTLIHIQTIANDYDIQDYRVLRDMIGDEDYIGKDLLKELDKEYYYTCVYTEDSNWNYYCAMNESNPMLASMYFYIASQAMKDADFHQKLYDKILKKITTFDNISNATANLFQGTKGVRKAVTTAEEQLTSFFKNGEYVMSGDATWRGNLARAVMDCEQNRYVSLASEGGLKITHQGKTYFGGDQQWFANGTPIGEAIAKRGCGITAIIDYQYYINGITEVSKDDYMTRTIDFLNREEELKDFIVNGDKGMNPYFLLSDIDAESYLDTIAKEAGFSGAKWNRTQEVPLVSIKRQLLNNVPVLINVEGISDHTAGIELYQSQSDCYNGANPKMTVNDNYMTVTGIYEKADIDTGAINHILQVNSGGEAYYMNYEKYLDYKNQLLEDNNFVVDAFIKSNNNISEVIF